MNNIWIINGIPGAGKSTVARALAQHYARGVHIEGDRVQECIVSGAVLPGQLPVEEERRQIHLNVKNQCLLARSFAEAGFAPVLDYVVVNRERVVEYQSHLDGFALRLVTLVPGVAVALTRDHLRPEKTVAHFWTHLDEIMRTELAGVGLWVDNANQTVEETVDYILQRQAQAGV